ncbi:TetR/AcrR family transcriptional regulator [Lentzea tibetensis]|uniref:TetR/AcrR family transcriptional regulator n=1 Tax=Lentzea tibetensis TaxID=2591470 RepID=A0A563EEU3_9PSEU|nr:TetR/AcrR family transcriptional regulator [Lentzea tibetensis]TWP43504.1 TetR/AcrR family transcriptional regulator [Lentzea tibetensis]
MRDQRSADRSDARRNRKRLLDAATHVLRTEPATATMQSIAQRAALSQATAYRHFSSLDALVVAYNEDVVDGLREHGSRSKKTGKELFEHVVTRWVKLQGVHGPVIVRDRSRRGFLERLRTGDPVVASACAAWDAPLRGVLAELELPEQHLDAARVLHNVLFDPREIIDLTKTAGFAEAQVVRRLCDAFYAALEGWART